MNRKNTVRAPQAPEQLEIRVRWEGTVLATAILAQHGSVVLGDHGRSIAYLPEEVLGSESFVIAQVVGHHYQVYVPPGAVAYAERAGTALTLPASAAHIVNDDERITVRLGAFHIELVHARRASAPPRMTLAESLGKSAARHVLGAACVHGAFLAVFAYYTPALAAYDDPSQHRDNVDTMRAYLVASAIREREAQPEPANSTPGEAEGATAAAPAEGREGSMGSPAAATTHGRSGKLGMAAEPVLLEPAERDAQLADARSFGIISTLAAMRAPSAAWAVADLAGGDLQSAIGHMWDNDVGDAVGNGGLRLSGIGEGGGGRDRVGIGLDGHDPFGHALGRGLGDDGVGRGSCKGCSLGSHSIATPITREGQVTVNGRIPAEVIQRVIRGNMGRFRGCYESGLRENPALAGRVVTRFAIDRQGLVTSATDGGSSLADPRVVSCVVKAFYGLSFPEHEGSIVTVVYPLSLAPL